MKPHMIIVPMNELFVLAILLLLAFGQVYSLFYGREAAVIYWICVSPLSYFSVWKYVTWDPGRVCGFLLVAGILFLYPKIKYRPPLPLVLLSIYGIILTLVMTPFVPIPPAFGRSIAYGMFRPIVQVGSWALMFLIAFEIAGLLTRRPSFFFTLRRVLLVFGVAMTLYGIVQYFAMSAGYETTGIRRAYLEVGGESEQIAGFVSGDTVVRRVNSFFSEPKHFGQFVLVCLLLLISKMFVSEKSNKIVATPSNAFMLLLFAAGMWVSYSTSAWGGVFVLAFFAAWGMLTLRGRTSPVLVVFMLFAFVGIYTIMPINSEQVGNIMEARTTARIAKGVFSDRAEQETIAILRDKPELIPCGVGLGNISFFIAERVGRTDVILTPNSGLLSTLSSIGVVGIMLLIFAALPKLYIYAIGSHRQRDIAMALVGLVCLTQTFIYPTPWLLTISIAFLSVDFSISTEPTGLDSRYSATPV